MLESLVKYNEIERRPWIMFPWALLLSSVGILFSLQLSYQVYISGNVFNLTGLFSVIFTIIPSVYFLTLFIKKEEAMDEKDIARHYEKGFWLRHNKDILIFLFYFFGLTFSFAFWANALPAGTFQIQTMKVQEIRALVGNMLEGSAGLNEFGAFTQVLANNLQVTGFAFIFSLLFGAGAVFIIVWNASILGVYIGRLSEAFYHIPAVSLNFLPHGIPEIGCYLLAGIGGSLISAAVIRSHKKDIMFGVILDALKLLGLGILFVFLGDVIETSGFMMKVVSIFIFYTIFIFIITTTLTSKRKNS